MDKTYNDLMDIVNRTKKFDTPSKARPKPRPAPREEVEEEFENPAEYDVVEKPKRKTKSSSSLFDDNSAIGSLLEKTSRKKTTKVSTTKKTPAKKKPKEEKAKDAEELETKVTEEPKAKVKPATKPAVKPVSTNLDKNDPKNAQLYAALHSSLFSGGTDISEYMKEDEEMTATQESLKDLRAKREAQKLNAEITKEQQEYEQLFTGSLGSFYQDETVEEEVVEEEKVQVNVEEKNAQLASDLDKIKAGLEFKKKNPNAPTSPTMSVEREKRASDTTFELETGNKDLDKKIAEYYKRKQEKIDKYNAEEENFIEPETKQSDNEPVDYDAIFGGSMMTRDELLGITPEEKTTEEVTQEETEEVETEVAENGEVAETTELVEEVEETEEPAIVSEEVTEETSTTETEENETTDKTTADTVEEQVSEKERDEHIKSLLSDLLYSKKEFEEEVKERRENEVQEENTVSTQNTESVETADASEDTENTDYRKDDYASVWGADSFEQDKEVSEDSDQANEQTIDENSDTSTEDKELPETSELTNSDTETIQSVNSDETESSPVEGDNFVMTDAEPEPQEVVEYADRSVVAVDPEEEIEETSSVDSSLDDNENVLDTEPEETSKPAPVAIVEDDDDDEDFVFRKATPAVSTLEQPTAEVTQEETEQVETEVAENGEVAEITEPVEEVEEETSEAVEENTETEEESVTEPAQVEEESDTGAQEEISDNSTNSDNTNIYNLSNENSDLDDYIVSSNIEIENNNNSIPEELTENDLHEDNNQSLSDEEIASAINKVFSEASIEDNDANQEIETVTEEQIAEPVRDSVEETEAEDNSEVVEDEVPATEQVEETDDTTMDIVTETDNEPTTVEPNEELNTSTDETDLVSVDEVNEEVVELINEEKEENDSNHFESVVANERIYEQSTRPTRVLFDDDDDDNTLVMSTLPENRVDLFGNEVKLEDEDETEEVEEKEEEKDDTISKEEFYNEMARLQENLINELKGNQVKTESVDFFKDEEKDEDEDLVEKVATKIIEVLEEQGVEDEEETEETPAEETPAPVEETPVQEVEEEKVPTSVIPEAEVGSKAEPVDPEKFDEYNLLGKEVALNDEDLEYQEKSEEEKVTPTDNYFYLSPEDNEKKAVVDEYMTIYDESSSSKEVGDINIFKSIGNATPSSEIIKEQNEPVSKIDTDENEIETIYTLMGIEKRTMTKEKNNIKVLYVASECQPFIASGGLADVAGSLPRAIAEQGDIDIRVIMPLYGNIKADYKDKFEYLGNFTVHLSWRQEYCGLFRYFKDGVTYYFIDNERYFKRDKLYGYYDDGERFAYFSKAIVEALPHLNFFPDIIHCNDWQSSLVSTYIKTGNWSDFRYYKIKNIYTIHNVEYQGVYGMENLKDLFGIDYRFRNDIEYNGDINLTKGAIQYCDKFTTVSNSYCDNLKQPYCSRGLHHIIIRNEYKLSGIINGIDYDFYNPATDTQIFKNYDLGCIEEKVLNKKLWQDEIGLPVDGDTPMISIVSRLVSHKGLDLITKIIHQVLTHDIQLVVVGTGDQKYVDFFHQLEEKYPTKVRVFVDTYSNELARKAYAASDIFVMPSKIEPCGLSQMIASRYGSIPIVREVGGLKDSIRDFGCEGGGNGYTFTNYNPNDLLYQIEKAIKDYSNKPEWKEKMKICMTQDFTWKKPALKYIDLYKSLMGN